MTAVTVAVVDPVHAALAVQRRELWVAGLPDTCPTCGGKGTRRVELGGGKWTYRACSDCNGTGHLSVSGPAIIGTTSTPVNLGPAGRDHQVWQGGTGNEIWLAEHGQPIYDGTRVYRSSILGTASALALPIVHAAHRWPLQDVVVPGPGWLAVFRYDFAGHGESWERSDDISEWLPFGLWEPGGVAYHFTGIRPEIDWPKPDETCPVGDPEEGPLHCGHWYECEPCHRCGDDTIDMTCDCDRCTAARERRACPISYPSAPAEPCITRIEVTV